MKFTGKIRKYLSGRTGSMYIFLTIFLVVLFLVLSSLVFAMRLFILSSDIHNAYERNGADLITKLRVDYYMSVTETNPESIHTNLNHPSSAVYRQAWLDRFIDSLSKSLLCTFDNSSGGCLTKTDAEGRVIYHISNFVVTYSDSVGTIRSVLQIPIQLGKMYHLNYTTNLEYSFALSYK